MSMARLWHDQVRPGNPAIFSACQTRDTFHNRLSWITSDPIFDVVLKRITVRGSIVGTRRDLDEAIAFAADGKVRVEFTKAPLSEINTIFERMKSGKIDGRIVLDFG